MNEIHSIRPLLAILVSAIASLLILFSDRSRNLRETWTILASVLKFLITLSLLPLVLQGNVITFNFFELFPGVVSGFRVDALGLYFALLSSGLWIITSIYSIGYMRSLKEHEQTRYFFSFALSLSATLGIAFAGDLITFFIFYELLTLATYPLVTHKETPEAIQGGRKYLVYSLSAAALLLIAIAVTYTQTGQLTFQAGGFLGSMENVRLLTLLLFLFLYGCAVKAALFPVHAWLPTAMVAPTPVSALLHAVAVVKAGAFGVLRIVGYVFGPEILQSTGLWQVIAVLAGFTILGASFIALAQDNLKRRLAYSTISQLSYIILGAALVTPSAYQGSILHLANHAFLKITLFFCAGVIYVKTHKENISDMRGIGYSLPWTMTLFAAASIGLSGFPPMNGFISKWFLCKGALEAGSWAALAVYLISALLNAAYLLPVVVTAFSKPKMAADLEWTPKTLITPPVVTGFLALVFGCLPFVFFSQIRLAAVAVKSIFGA